MDAARIHNLGLEEVKRIRAEMEKTLEGINFLGTLEQFLGFMRTDPRFFYKTPEELMAAYEKTARGIEPQLPKLFGRLPKTPFGIRAIPAASAPTTTTAYYQPPSLDGSRPGNYYVNLYKPETRPMWEIEALTAHESVPGHHLQIALSYELTGLPQFRRNAGYTAFVEGWALYSEKLGYDLGLYKDDFSKFGQLNYDMWRAVRLVVDTGMHAFKWIARPGHLLLQAEHRQERARHRQRGRPLHLMAGPGAGVQDRSAQDPGAARRGREGAWATGSTCAPSTTSSWAAAPCRLSVLEAEMRAWIAEQSARR